MRYAIAALIAAVVTVRVTTIYLLRRGRRSWVEPAPGAGALTDELDDWYSELVPMTAWRSN